MSSSPKQLMLAEALSLCHAVVTMVTTCLLSLITDAQYRLQFQKMDGCILFYICDVTKAEPGQESLL